MQKVATNADGSIHLCRLYFQLSYYKILRDTGVTQSLHLCVLPLRVSTSTVESVIVLGIEGGCVKFTKDQLSIRLSYWFCCGGHQAHFAHNKGVFVIGK